MDTFFEQIISVKKSLGNIACAVGIWILALPLCFFAYLIIPSLSALLILGILYGAFKLSTMFNIEYEYIVTNGTFDVDKIINKSKRKRILSFELSNVTRLEKYNPSILNNINTKDVTFACSRGDDNVYLMVAEKEGKNPYYLVLSPNDKIKSVIVKYVPKFISNSAFK